MAPITRVAVIQLYPKPLDITHNHATAVKFIREAAKQGAHLAVLPEYHLTSWVPDDAAFADLAGFWESYLENYKVLAQELHICIAPGTIVQKVKDEKTGEYKLLNVATFISNDGSVLGSYQKKNLWHPERTHLTSSKHDPHEIIDTPIGPVGFLICWDLAFPEAFRELIAAGAKIVIIPTFWALTDCSDAGLRRNPMSESLFLTSTLTARAFENTCCVIFVNAASAPPNASGPLSGIGGAGLSRVTVPFIGAIPESAFEGGEEGMKVVDVDMEILEEAESNYKVREDLARVDWHYGYGVRPGKDTSNGEILT